MKKIAFMVPRLTKTGPVNVIYNILLSKERENFDCYIITSKNEISENSRVEEFKSLGVKIYPLKQTNIILKYFELRNFVKKGQFSLINAHSISSLFYICFLKVYKAFSLHFDIQHDWLRSGNKKSLFLYHIVKFALKRMDVIICCADYMAKSLKQEFNSVVSIPNGVTYNENYKKNYRNLGIRKSFIYCGSLNARKNVLELVSDFNEYHKANEYLYLAGIGDFYERLKNVGYQNIVLLGFCDDLEIILQDMDYFISYSKSEGLPLAVLEAMSMGLPVVLSDIPGHTEIIDNRLCAGVIKKGTLRESLDKIFSFDYKFLSDNARAIISEKYSIDIMAKKYFAVFKEGLIL